MGWSRILPLPIVNSINVTTIRLTVIISIVVILVLRLSLVLLFVTFSVEQLRPDWHLCERWKIIEG